MKNKKEDQEKLVCIGVDGKIDKDTLMYWEVMDENGETKLKKGKGEEHHFTFTKEPGTESGRYLTHRVIPVKGATAAVLSDEVHSVLKEFNSFHTPKAVLVNTNQIQNAKEALLRSLRIKLSGNCTPLVVHSIRISFLSELFSNTLMAVPKSKCFHWSTWKTLWNWPPWSAPGWIRPAQWSPRSHEVWRDDVGWSQ